MLRSGKQSWLEICLWMMSVAHCGGTLRMGKVCLPRLAWSRLLVLHGAWWSATERSTDSYSLLACLAKVTIIVTTVLSTVNYLPTHFVPAKDITTIYQLFTIRLSKQQVEPMIKTTTEHSREGMDEIKRKQKQQSIYPRTTISQHTRRSTTSPSLHRQPISSLETADLQSHMPSHQDQHRDPPISRLT